MTSESTHVSHVRQHRHTALHADVETQLVSVAALRVRVHGHGHPNVAAPHVQTARQLAPRRIRYDHARRANLPTRDPRRKMEIERALREARIPFLVTDELRGYFVGADRLLELRLQGVEGRQYSREVRRGLRVAIAMASLATVMQGCQEVVKLPRQLRLHEKKLISG